MPAESPSGRGIMCVKEKLKLEERSASMVMGVIKERVEFLTELLNAWDKVIPSDSKHEETTLMIKRIGSDGWIAYERYKEIRGKIELVGIGHIMEKELMRLLK